MNSDEPPRVHDDDSDASGAESNEGGASLVSARGFGRISGAASTAGGITRFDDDDRGLKG